jgi:hypothetical protein
MILLGKRFDIFEHGQKHLQLFGSESVVHNWVRDMMPGAPSLSWLLAHRWVVERVTWDSLDAIEGTAQPMVNIHMPEESACGAESLAGFACTITPGHKSDHMAHSSSLTHPVYAWSLVTG